MPKLMIIWLLAALLASCASIREARMVLPAGLGERTEVVEIPDIGGAARGRWSAAGHHGEFKRSETRLEFFDFYERRAGSTRFTLRGPLIEGEIEAKCRMREHHLKMKAVDFVPKKMAYRCEFTVDGRAFPARFELQESSVWPGGATLMARRRGELAIDRVVLQLESVHELEGSRIPLDTPIGYTFAMDGHAVGAIELNGRPRVFMPLTDEIPLRRAVLVASLAVALFWDPADSQL